jgi:hydrogenase/urease accessory protein HupE
MTGWRAVLGVLLVAAGAAAPASAHQINLTQARIAIGPERVVTVEIAIKGSDLDRVAGTDVFDAATGLVRADALAASATPITRYVVRHAVVLGENEARCRAGAAAVSADDDGVLVRVQWSCTAVADPLTYRSTVLTESDPSARQIVLIGNSEQSLLDASQTDVALTGDTATGLGAIILSYVSAGIEHIFIGYDHIAFLVAIVLWARRLPPVIKIVTAFTLAHSLTLSLAVLDIIRIPSAIVEPAIAASIVYVAAENFLSRDIERRWRITFFFGLIHGLGFAGALREFGLPTGALAPALASFNIGVEIGQIGIVSMALPALLGLDRLFAAAVAPRAAPLVYTLSAAIGGLGCYWFLMRTVIA